MMMFLMIASMSVLALALMALVTSAGRIPEEKPPEILELRPMVSGSPHFFGRVHAPNSRAAHVPIEVLINEIERHVRLEQAAAETFLAQPAIDLLHSPSASRLVN
jgi:hypothetical protein